MSARKDGSANGDLKEANRKRAREGGPVRYSARVQYDGTDFAGFQIQSGSRTVQGELERALGRLSGGSRIRVEGAGRTDAGVHARGQVIAFTYRGRLDRDELHRALTALLPRDIGLGTLRKVEAGFRPRYRARYREYRYLVWNGPPSPLRERYALGVREPLDVEAMAEAATVFVGRHDFSAFGGRDRQPVRTVHEVRVRRQGRSITIVVSGTPSSARWFAEWSPRCYASVADRQPWMMSVASSSRVHRRSPARRLRHRGWHSGKCRWGQRTDLTKKSRTSENDEQDIYAESGRDRAKLVRG